MQIQVKAYSVVSKIGQPKKDGSGPRKNAYIRLYAEDGSTTGVTVFESDAPSLAEALRPLAGQKASEATPVAITVEETLGLDSEGHPSRQFIYRPAIDAMVNAEIDLFE